MYNWVRKLHPLKVKNFIQLGDKEEIHEKDLTYKSTQYASGAGNVDADVAGNSYTRVCNRRA